MNLPYTAIYKILDYLSPVDLASALRVNKEFRDIAYHDLLADRMTAVVKQTPVLSDKLLKDMLREKRFFHAKALSMFAAKLFKKGFQVKAEQIAVMIALKDSGYSKILYQKFAVTAAKRGNLALAYAYTREADCADMVALHLIERHDFKNLQLFKPLLSLSSVCTKVVIAELEQTGHYDKNLARRCYIKDLFEALMKLGRVKEAYPYYRNEFFAMLNDYGISREDFLKKKFLVKLK